MSESGNPPSGKWEIWQAYGDLFKVVADGMEWSQEAMASKMEKDAKSTAPRCTYTRRDFDYWKAQPKEGKRSRIPRSYRRKHLYKFLSEKIGELSEQGKIRAEDYVLRLAVIAPPAPESPIPPSSGFGNAGNEPKQHFDEQLLSDHLSGIGFAEMQGINEQWESAVLRGKNWLKIHPEDFYQRAMILWTVLNKAQPAT